MYSATYGILQHGRANYGYTTIQDNLVYHLACYYDIFVGYCTQSVVVDRDTCIND